MAPKCTNFHDVFSLCLELAFSVMPTPQLNLHLHVEPPEFHVALTWWLGMDTSQNSCCLFCPSQALDSLGHHALTCKSGCDLIVRHNSLWDTRKLCQLASIACQIKAVNGGLDIEGRHTHPSDSLGHN